MTCAWLTIRPSPPQPASGRPLLAVFVHDEKTEGLRPLGGAALWWLHGVLDALSDGLAVRGGQLFFFRGPAADLIERLAVNSRAAAIYWNRRYDEAGQLVDKKLKAALRQRGLVVESFNGHLLHEPWTMAKQGKPFRVFSAFWRAACRLGAPPRPIPSLKPYPLAYFRQLLGRASSRLPILRSSPSPRIGPVACAQHGSAVSRVRRRVSNGSLLAACPAMRPIEIDQTSRTPRGSLPIFASATSPSARSGMPPWRRWCSATRVSASKTLRSSCRNSVGASSPIICSIIIQISRVAIFTQFDFTPWRMDPVALRAWQHGQTGYPFVDAGMQIVDDRLGA